MDTPIEYRSVKEADARQVSSFISEVFNQYVAPEFSQDGIDAFMTYIQPDALANHLTSNHFGIIASVFHTIIGAIIVRDDNHVALFFVESRHQRRGIGKKLLQMAQEHCCRKEINTTRITVNASPNSIDAYKRLNFEPTDKEQCENGIRFVPMSLRL